MSRSGWLTFAATPTFALMAVVNAMAEGPGAMSCGALPGGSPLGGMATMYALMSAFHAAPWLGLLGSWLSSR